MIADASAQEDKPRFLADMNFNARIVVGLRRIIPGVDLITAQGEGFHETPDPELLAEARRLNRILLTHDINTLPGHFAYFLAYLSENEHSPGVMLIAQELAI